MMEAGSAFWTSFTEAHTDRHVCFRLKVSKKELEDLGEDTSPPLVQRLHLRASHSLKNMHAISAEGNICKVESPLEVIKRHAPVRLRMYEVRWLWMRDGMWLPDSLWVGRRVRIVHNATRYPAPFTQRCEALHHPIRQARCLRSGIGPSRHLGMRTYRALE